MGLLLTLALTASLSFSAIVFEKKTIKLGKEQLLVEVADTPEKLGRGLMERTELKENEGMLFVFTNEEVRRFWMKNTLIPLSIGFYDKEKILVDLQDMEPPASVVEVPKVYASKSRAQYALEVKRGWFKRHGIGLKSSFQYLPKSDSKSQNQD